MAYSYPIWNDVQACIYGSSKSWGAKDTCNVYVDNRIIKRALFDKKNKTFNFLDREPMTTNQEPNPKQLELF